MKKGDIIIGPSIEELLKTEACHKWSPTCSALCGAEFPLSHEDWENVNCPQCLALRHIQ